MADLFGMLGLGSGSLRAPGDAEVYEADHAGPRFAQHGCITVRLVVSPWNHHACHDAAFSTSMLLQHTYPRVPHEVATRTAPVDMVKRKGSDSVLGHILAR